MSLDKNALAVAADRLAAMYRGGSEDEPFHAMATVAIEAYLAALPTTSVSEPTGHCAKCGRDWGDVGVERCDECPTTDAPSEPVSDLVKRLRGFAQAYPEDMFPPLTEEERGQLGGEIISRASAEMGRHFAKFATEAADALEHRSLAEGWRPIETAPKGKSVIVALQDEEAGWIVAEARYRDVGDDDDGWWWANETPGDYYANRIDAPPPSLWQPLPQPPEAK